MLASFDAVVVFDCSDNLAARFGPQTDKTFPQR